MAGAYDLNPTPGQLDSGYTPRTNGVKRPAPPSSPSRQRFSSATGKSKQECIVILDSVSPEPHDHSITGYHIGRSFSSQTAALTAEQYVEISSSSETEAVPQEACHGNTFRRRSSSGSSLLSLTSSKKAKLEPSPGGPPTVRFGPSIRLFTPVPVSYETSYAAVLKSAFSVATDILPQSQPQNAPPLQLEANADALPTLSRTSTLIIPETLVESPSPVGSEATANIVKYQGSPRQDLKVPPVPGKQAFVTGAEDLHIRLQPDTSCEDEIPDHVDGDFELEPALSADDIDVGWRGGIHAAGAPESPRSLWTSPSRKSWVQSRSNSPQSREDASSPSTDVAPASTRRGATPRVTSKLGPTQPATHATKPVPPILQSQQPEQGSKASNKSVLRGGSCLTDSGDESSPVEVTSVWPQSPGMRNRQGSQLDARVDRDERILSPVESDDEIAYSRASHISQGQQRILDRPRRALPTSPWRTKSNRRATRLKSRSNYWVESSCRKRPDNFVLESIIINGTRRSNRTDAKARRDSNGTDHDDADVLNAPIRRRSDISKAQAGTEQADCNVQEIPSDWFPDEEDGTTAPIEDQMAASKADEADADPSERIARMRARMAAAAGLKLDSEREGVDAGVLSNDDELRFMRRPARHIDDDDDDLADAAVLIKAAIAAKAVVKVETPPKMKLKPLPKDAATLAVEALSRKRVREKKRGWYGADEADRKYGIAKIESPGVTFALEAEYSSEDGHDMMPGRESNDNAPNLLSATMLQRAAAAFTTNEEKETLRTIQKERQRMDENAKREGEIKPLRDVSPWISAEESPLRVKPFVAYEVAVATGFDRKVREAIRGKHGLGDPSAFPVELFSVASHIPAITLQECTPSMHNLFELIAHPLTQSALARRAMYAFSMLWQHALSRDVSAATPFIVTMNDVVNAFLSMGLKRTSIPAPLILMDVADIEYAPAQNAASESFNHEDRLAAALRLIEVGRLICLESTSETAGYVDLCLRLAWDPSQGTLRRACLANLRSTLYDCLDDDRIEAIYDAIRTRLHSCSRHEQAATTTFIGLQSGVARQLSTTLSYSLLFDPEASFGTAKRETHGLMGLSRMFVRTSSPFVVLPESNDDSLYWSTSMLGILLSNSYSNHFWAASQSSEKVVRIKALEESTALIDQLKKTESRIRLNLTADTATRTRAKNALTRITHGLEYQVQMYQKRIARFEREITLPKDQNFIRTGQLTINSFFSTRAPSTEAPTIADHSIQ